MSDSGSNTWVQDGTVTATDAFFYRCQSIGTVPSTLSLDHSGTVFTYCIVLEVSGLDSSPAGTLVENTNTAHGSSHTQGYTTNNDGDLVFAFMEDGNDNYVGASGTSSLFRDTSEARGGLYKVVSTAETGNLNWTSDTARSLDVVAHIVYAADTGGGSVIPQARYYYNMQLS